MSKVSQTREDRVRLIQQTFTLLNLSGVGNEKAAQAIALEAGVNVRTVWRWKAGVVPVQSHSIRVLADLHNHLVSEGNGAAQRDIGRVTLFEDQFDPVLRIRFHQPLPGDLVPSHRKVKDLDSKELRFEQPKAFTHRELDNERRDAFADGAKYAMAHAPSDWVGPFVIGMITGAVLAGALATFLGSLPL